MKTEILAAIGRVITNFAVLEHQLGIFVAVLIGQEDQQVTQCITAELSFRNLVNLSRSLHSVREPDEKIRAELSSIFKDIFEAEEKRNVIVHSLWGYGGDENVMTRIKITARKELKWQLEPMGKDEINEIAKSISETGYELQDFLKNHRYDFRSDKP